MIKKFILVFTLTVYPFAQASACTREYMPVCGKLPDQTQTFPNRCVMNKAGAVFSSDGECNPPPLSKDVTLIVAPQDIACMGVGPMRCLQVKVGDAKNWSAHYENIEGFTFIPGFEYTLWVRITWIAKPPADGSSARFTLLRELSRTPSD
jgi:hypothetical protein